MFTKKDVSRRLFLKGAASAAGAAAALRLPGGQFERSAFAQQAEKSAVLVVYFGGGYNALFPSADSFLGAGTFGVNNNNTLNLGNGLVVDRSFDVFPAIAKQRMATIGVRHGSSDHGEAQRLNFSSGTRSAVLMLASMMGGDAAIKAANVGPQNIPGPTTPEGGVSLQRITDMRATIAALGGAQDPTIPDRDIAAKALIGAEAMSQNAYAASPKSLTSVREGLKASIETLQKPVRPFNFTEMATAYGLQATVTGVTDDFRTKMLAAELMVLAGANVVTAPTRFDWDSHGDRDGSAVRQRMTTQILPALSTFVNRMMAATDRNVVVMMLGDFSRSLPGSDHQPNLSATIIGKYVNVGTTGKVGANVSLPAGTPSVGGMWGMAAAAVKAPAAITAFGGNPHGALIRP